MTSWERQSQPYIFEVYEIAVQYKIVARKTGQHTTLYKGAKRRGYFYDITKRISIQQTDCMIGTMHSASHSRVIIDSSRTKEE
jgi:hypothetical protein